MFNQCMGCVQPVHRKLVEYRFITIILVKRKAVTATRTGRLIN